MSEIKRKKRSKNSEKNFSTYIYKVLKQVHPDTGISSNAMNELNSMVLYLVERIMNAVNLLTSQNKKKTISARDIQGAVRMVLPGELAKHAVSEGTKALTRFNSTKGGGPGAPTSKSMRAQLQFPVTRTENLMMSHAIVNRKGEGAAVYLAAVLEYLTAEVIELAGNVARDSKRVRITPRHISLAVGNDEELHCLYACCVMSGGVSPSYVAPKKKKK